MGSRLDEIIDSSMATLVGIVLLCAAVIPTGIDFISKLTGDATQYQPLLYLVMTISILALIVGVLKTFQSKER